jgi:RND family efflux transporter, MFP subunit
MKKKVFIVIAAVIVIVLISVKLVINKEKIDNKKRMPDASLKKVSVTIKTVAKQEVNGSLSLVGSTMAKNEVVLQSEISAQVKDLHFKIGDYVSKGKLLVQLDDRLRALSLESAKLNLSKMEDEYSKTKNLYDGKASSETQLRDAKLNYETAKVNVEQAKKQLDMARIIAPQNGFIVQKWVETGSFVNVGTQIVSLVDLSQLKAAVNVAERDVYKLKSGQKVTVSSSVFPAVTFSGEISFISAKGDNTHNYPVEITINNQQAHQLKAGTFVNVDFNFNSNVPALLLPRKALTGSVKDAKVYVVKNDIARLVSVTIGRDLGDYFEVLNGLSEGDNVVIDGQVNLTDGDNVLVIKKETGK